MLVEPGDISLKAVALVARHGQAKELAGVDDKLPLDAEAFERLVHQMPDKFWA